MGLSRRLPLAGLEFLIEDRLAKGFTVIQIIAGLYPDMDWHDERGLGDGGFPWDRDFTSINPEYFRAMDRRIGMLVNAGLSPCIVGYWGYFMDFAGCGRTAPPLAQPRGALCQPARHLVRRRRGPHAVLRGRGPN